MKYPIPILTRSIGLLALTLLLVVAGCEQATLPTAETLDDAPVDGEVIPGQYIVVLHEGAGKTAADVIDQVVRIEGVAPIARYEHTLTGFAASLTPGALADLERDPRVKYIEPDRVMVLAPPCGTPNGGPCPPDDGNGGGGGDSSQETPYGITRVNGGIASTGVACVLDTGIDLDHEDLNVDASRGFNAFSSGRDGKSLDDGNGHGTHVAGTIAAKDNSVGVIGVAAGATVVPIKVLDSRGSGSYSGVIAGIDYVGSGAAGCSVANMSLGGGFSQAVNDAVIDAAGSVAFSLAAGNESTDAGTRSPASANGTNIVTISAINSSDAFASFSNFGNPPVDYAAPGVSIKSTYKNGGYATLSGTSMAAPHVAGILLLGNISTDGNASGDPDGNADPIAVH